MPGSAVEERENGVLGSGPPAAAAGARPRRSRPTVAPGSWPARSATAPARRRHGRGWPLPPRGATPRAVAVVRFERRERGQRIRLPSGGGAQRVHQQRVAADALLVDRRRRGRPCPRRVPRRGAGALVLAAGHRVGPRTLWACPPAASGATARRRRRRRRSGAAEPGGGEQRGGERESGVVRAGRVSEHHEQRGASAAGGPAQLVSGPSAPRRRAAHGAARGANGGRSATHRRRPGHAGVAGAPASAGPRDPGRFLRRRGKHAHVDLTVGLIEGGSWRGSSGPTRVRPRPVPGSRAASRAAGGADRRSARGPRPSTRGERPRRRGPTVRAAEAEHGLVRAPASTTVRGGAPQHPHQLHLLRVEVMRVVDQEVPYPGTLGRERLGMLASVQARRDQLGGVQRRGVRLGRAPPEPAPRSSTTCSYVRKKRPAARVLRDVPLPQRSTRPARARVRLPAAAVHAARRADPHRHGRPQPLRPAPIRALCRRPHDQPSSRSRTTASCSALARSRGGGVHRCGGVQAQYAEGVGVRSCGRAARGWCGHRRHRARACAAAPATPPARRLPTSSSTAARTAPRSAGAEGDEQASSSRCRGRRRPAAGRVVLGTRRRPASGSPVRLPRRARAGRGGRNVVKESGGPGGRRFDHAAPTVSGARARGRGRGMDEGTVERLGAAVRAIPPGQVRSYGEVAEEAGLSSARLVGRVLAVDGHDLAVAPRQCARTAASPHTSPCEQAAGLRGRGHPRRDGRVPARPPPPSPLSSRGTAPLRRSGQRCRLAPAKVPTRASKGADSRGRGGNRVRRWRGGGRCGSGQRARGNDIRVGAQRCGRARPPPRPPDGPGTPPARAATRGRSRPAVHRPRAARRRPRPRGGGCCDEPNRTFAICGLRREHPPCGPRLRTTSEDRGERHHITK